MKNKAKGLAIGALIIGAAGYVAGILTAPKSGKETIADIDRVRNRGVREAEKQLKGLHTELNQLIGEAEGYVKDKKHTFTHRNDNDGEGIEGEIITKATRARQKAREILSALHDGNADDDDLDKAITQASKSIKSIRNYLRK